mmetsp:Transcript_18943/g.33189  ORF Transcript_18943/g.33189 Transcript_18943/m.33189 type:complete len:132 (-) Transcript_18943:412-807(-)
MRWPHSTPLLSRHCSPGKLVEEFRQPGPSRRPSSSTSASPQKVSSTALSRGGSLPRPPAAAPGGCRGSGGSPVGVVFVYYLRLVRQDYNHQSVVFAFHQRLVCREQNHRSDRTIEMNQGDVQNSAHMFLNY